MVKEFKNTLFKVIHLRSIIGYNGLVYALKKTPVIGKILPDKLYSTMFLKVIYWIFHVIVEVFKLFIGKIAGLGLIYLFSFFLTNLYIDDGMVPGVSRSSLFASFALLFFMLYAVCGLLLRRSVFSWTTDKEYMVFMLRMNARKLNYTLFIYDLAKLVIGYLIAGIIGAVVGAPFWLLLGMPVLAVLIKLFGTGFQASRLRQKRKRHKILKLNVTVNIVLFTLMLMASPLVIMLVANGYYIPLPVMLAVAGIMSLLGVWGYRQCDKFDSIHHRRVLHDNIGKNEMAAYASKPDSTKSFKKLKAKGSVKDNKKGFEYLNALFLKRHSGMIVVKPIVFTVIIFVVMGLMIAEFIYLYYEKFGADNCLNMIGNNILNIILFRQYEDNLLPFEADAGGVFFRWLAQSHMLAMLLPISIADNTFKSTQAMYINCDNCLMTFSFFKQREKIIKLFDIRFKQLIEIHLAPAIASGLFANLILFYTGGQDFPFQYLLSIVVCIMLSVCYSLTWLAMYYLFQPFTTTVNVKSGIYNVTRIIISVVLTVVVLIPSNTFVLTLVMLVFTAVFVYVMRKLVYKHAPKTWKAKS